MHLRALLRLISPTALAGLFACAPGTTDDSVGTGLDGTWDVTFSNTADPSADRLASATMIITGGEAKLTAISRSEGKTGGQGCKYTTSRAEIDFSIPGDATKITGDPAFLNQNDGTCSGPTGSLIRKPQSPFSITKSGEAASSFGTIGGDWKLVHDEEICTFRIAGNTLEGTCNNRGREIFEGKLTATINGGTISGRIDAGGEFVAKKQ